VALGSNRRFSTWISVSERLPDLNQIVLVCYPSASDGKPIYAWGARYAEFALNMAYGARTSAKKYGLKVVYDKSYPPTATDFTPIMRAVQATKPDIVFVGSYPPDSVGILKAANEIRLKTKMFGGGMGSGRTRSSPQRPNGV